MTGERRKELISDVKKMKTSSTRFFDNLPPLNLRVYSLSVKAGEKHNPNLYKSETFI
jgi:hypothetical protein